MYKLGGRNVQPAHSQDLNDKGEQAADDEELVFVEEGGFVLAFDCKLGVGLAGVELEDCGC